MATTQTSTTAFQDAACDCVGLVTLLHRAIAGQVARDGQRADWADAGSMQRLRASLIEALVPTRELQDEGEAREEILALVAQVRPRRI